MLADIEDCWDSNTDGKWGSKSSWIYWFSCNADWQHHLWEPYSKITLVKYYNFNEGKRKILQKRKHNQVNKISHPVVIQEKIAQPVLFLETHKKINTSD